MSGTRPTRRDRQGGFSVIELVGVLAIISLIAAAAAPAFIKRVDHDFRTAEQQKLKKLGEGLRASCIRNQQILASGNWAATIASNLDPDQATPR